METTGIEAWGPLERMLWDHAEGRSEAVAKVFMEDGGDYDLPAQVFFQSEEEFGASDLLALDLCHGSILDVGAGAGRHSLVLQERNANVGAMDICPRLVRLQELRGVRNASQGDILDPRWSSGRTWETLLMLMNGIGLVGDLAGLGRFLRHADAFVAPGGRILLDSCDLTRLDDAAEAARIVARVGRGCYFGETRQKIHYRGTHGAWLPWLYVDPKTLAAYAGKAGWTSQVLFDGGDGSYLACLRRAS